MKNILILALLSVFLNADNNKSVVKEISDEDFLKQMKESRQKQEKRLIEIEKTDKFIQKLEEIKKKLEAEKLEMKQKENKK
jgi:hypothetical protein